MMTNDPQRQLMSKYNALQNRAQRLITDANLTEAMQDIKDIDADIARLPGELARARSRGYHFASHLELEAQVLNQGWDTKRNKLHRLIEQEGYALRESVQHVQRMLDDASRQLSNPFASVNILSDLEREIDDLNAKVKAAEQRVQSQFSALDQAVSQIVEHVQDIHGYMDQQDEAGFSFLPDEKLFLAAQGEWVATGKSGQDPDGTLFLTDQRLLFEQNEKTGKMLGLFGGKQTQELQWQVRLDQIKSVEAENAGLFGGKDLLSITLESGSPYSQITVEVKGKAKCKFWAAQIQRTLRGEINAERITPSARDSEMALVIKDVEVFPEADIVVPHGVLKQGAMIRLGKNPFRGQAYYTLISGEGPARGWVGFHALQRGEHQ